MDFFYRGWAKWIAVLLALIYAGIVLLSGGDYDFTLKAVISSLAALILIWSGDYLMESGYGRMGFQVPGFILFFLGWFILLIPGIVYMVNVLKR